MSPFPNFNGRCLGRDRMVVGIIMCLSPLTL